MVTPGAGLRSGALAGPPPTTRRELRELERRGRRPVRHRRSSRQAAAARRRAGTPRPARSLGQQLLSLGALLACGALFVGLSLPANALYPQDARAAEAAAVVAQPVQSLAVGAAVEDGAAVRSGYEVVSWAEILRQRYGNQSYDYTVGGTGSIRWPFPFPVPISDGFGDRVSPCRGCSSFHQGVDFTPGAGQPIYAIADGVVTLHEADNWSYGNTVEIEHRIDGHIVTSKYAHMQAGSSPLKVGDHVAVADFVGLVGDTGATTGPHLHFEIWIDGQKVNPFTWLKHYASS